MKKFLLSLLVLCSLYTSFSQENPCPDVKGVRLINRDPATCSGQVEVTASGDVQSPKGLQVEVICNGSVVQTTCFIVPKGSPATAYTTKAFTCPCGSSLSLRITRFTASNGTCGGGTCGTVLEIDESVLPVSFKSFSATRNKSNVSVKWTTASETDNKGFNVQRNTKGVWETVAFVFSAATGGTSTSDLSYAFTDLNNHGGVSQYRVQQVDLDGRSKYSEIRSVRGEAMATKLVVYPNPSETGKVNVVFDDQSPKSVQVSDMSGRVVRSLRNVQNSISIEGLESGVYSIQVTDLSTSALSVEKVIVKKR